VEANDCCIRQPAEFIDEIANCDHGGIGDCLAKSLAHGVTPPFPNQSLDGSVPSARHAALRYADWGSFFVAQEPMRHPIDEMGSRRKPGISPAERRRLPHSDILDPLLHILVSRRTAKHDAGSLLLHRPRVGGTRDPDQS